MFALLCRADTQVCPYNSALRNKELFFVDSLKKCRIILRRFLFSSIGWETSPNIRPCAYRADTGTYPHLLKILYQWRNTDRTGLILRGQGDFIQARTGE